MAAAALVAVLAATAVGCSSGKPSKEEFRDAIVSNAKATGLLSEKGGDELMRCMADEAYDDLSDEMVRATVDKDADHKPSKADMKVMGDASETCVARAMGTEPPESPESPAP